MQPKSETDATVAAITSRYVNSDGGYAAFCRAKAALEEIGVKPKRALELITALDIVKSDARYDKEAREKGWK